VTTLTIEEFVENQCGISPHTLDEYESDMARWCKGCGDHGVLSTVQRILRDEQVDPESVVSVSGIGCSSRFPHYLRSYGLHGIHGRALPLSTGVAIARPDLKVLTVMGDGDCFSIGAGHWLHTLRYNVNITVLVLDNEIYALTKNQVSPTSPEGSVTNTTPHGAYLKSMNPLSVIMGVPNVSFLAQTATWLPPHMEATIRRAWAHKGLSFVRILQRCPVYRPDAFLGAAFTGVFLEHPEGIEVDEVLLRNARTQPHDQRDIHAAQRIALQEEPAPLGLIYWNPDIPTYADVRYSHTKKVDEQGLIQRMNEELDKFTIEANE
jgi:2-oxoglutarate ferredoxin oxidoreductase subunit beta